MGFVPDSKIWRARKFVRCADGICNLGILQIGFKSAKILPKKTWDIIIKNQISVDGDLLINQQPIQPFWQQIFEE